MSRTNIVKCVDESTKKTIVEKFNKKSFKTKTKLAKEFDISLRTLNRILNEKLSEEINWDYIVTKNEITLYRNDDCKTIKEGFPSFNDIKTVLIKNDFSEDSLNTAWRLSCMKKQIETFSEGNITVDYESKQITYGAFVIENSLVPRIFTMLETNKDVLPLVKFLDKVMENPDKNIIEQLYPFLKHNDIEINNDGDIIAYRSVTLDYKDFHTRTMDNSIGSVVKMPRSMVNCNPKQTCSEGLHCAAHQYASSFGIGSNRLMKVLVNPKNVCSVPEDYDGQKMRTCEFTVLEEV